MITNDEMEARALAMAHQWDKEVEDPEIPLIAALVCDIQKLFNFNLEEWDFSEDVILQAAVDYRHGPKKLGDCLIDIMAS